MNSKFKKNRKRRKLRIRNDYLEEVRWAKRVISGMQKPDDYMTLNFALEKLKVYESKRI
tara:strand:+ start:174 stop:350 length:177 start_codon:yes stop_codon:yes gene_type:complete